MTRHKIALIAEGEPDISAVERGLGELDYDLVAHQPRSIEDTIAAISGSDVILTYAADLPKEAIASIDTAQAIVCVSHGFDKIDHDAATEHGIMVVNTPDMCTEEVANHALMLVLACSGRLIQMNAVAKSGVWERAGSEKAIVGAVYGQTIGMVGFGNIARAVARRASGFKMELLAYDPYVPPWAVRDYGVEMVGSLGELAERSDFVSMHVPLNNSTWRLAGEMLFRQMKPTAYFINTCRGGTVDEESLIWALQSGEIAGAGLDVFEQEPPEADNPLLSMNNVIATPHSAGSSPHSQARGLLHGGQEAARVLRGEWPMSLVNLEVRAKLGPRMPATNV